MYSSVPAASFCASSSLLSFCASAIFVSNSFSCEERRERSNCWEIREPQIYKIIAQNNPRFAKVFRFIFFFGFVFVPLLFSFRRSALSLPSVTAGACPPAPPPENSCVPFYKTEGIFTLPAPDSYFFINAVLACLDPALILQKSFL